MTVRFRLPAPQRGQILPTIAYGRAAMMRGPVSWGQGGGNPRGRRACDAPWF